MSQLIKRLLLAAALVSVVGGASAFTPMGPYASWQTPAIGYNPLGFDLGGPMNLGEEYRWNIPTVYYGYDESFLNYFGTAGTNAVEKAFAILNALPKVSLMSSNLDEFPTDTLRVNSTAETLGLVDLKSITLGMMVAEMGLTSPERYTWTLRNRIDTPRTYTVVKRNFDPVTLIPSSFVNGTLYTFEPEEFQNPTFADAVEIQVDPLQLPYTSVADAYGGLFGNYILFPGSYYTGLTRDDVGGLRYLYRPTNYQIENLVPGSTAATSGSVWDPAAGSGTNTTTTNNVVSAALRPGVDKITFKPAKYDSYLGAFIVFTNTYTDTYVSNSTVKTQSVQRVLLQPDILLTAEDLGIGVGGVPLLAQITDSSGWVNNDALNGQATLDGPGVIQPGIVLRYSKVGPYYINSAPAFLDLFQPIGGTVWGSFDGTTNAPVIFPNGYSIYDLEQQVLFGGGSGSGTGGAWVVPNSSITSTNTP